MIIGTIKSMDQMSFERNHYHESWIESNATKTAIIIIIYRVSEWVDENNHKRLSNPTGMKSEKKPVWTILCQSVNRRKIQNKNLPVRDCLYSSLKRKSDQKTIGPHLDFWLCANSTLASHECAHTHTHVLLSNWASSRIVPSVVINIRAHIQTNDFGKVRTFRHQNSGRTHHLYQ